MDSSYEAAVRLVGLLEKEWEGEPVEVCPAVPLRDGTSVIVLLLPGDLAFKIRVEELFGDEAQGEFLKYLKPYEK